MPELPSGLKTSAASIGIVTSNAPDNVQTFLTKKDMNQFDFIYSGTGIFSKNRIFKRINRLSRGKTKNIYYIGNETRDIQAGKKAGIKTISVTWGF